MLKGFLAVSGGGCEALPNSRSGEMESIIRYLKMIVVTKSLHEIIGNTKMKRILVSNIPHIQILAYCLTFTFLHLEMALSLFQFIKYYLYISFPSDYMPNYIPFPPAIHFPLPN